ncbi:MAG: hypothetical protein ACREJC_18775 [Tepidisphaeraceae bacterium]
MTLDDITDAILAATPEQRQRFADAWDDLPMPRIAGSEPQQGNERARVGETKELDCAEQLGKGQGAGRAVVSDPGLWMK